MMRNLTERQKLVLALLVKDYIETAEPISSGRLVEHYQLEISSATVRNEMAWLDEQGFLAQPYTSAGRVPTKQGYRYFVQQLMGADSLPSHLQQMIRHQFYQARHDVDDWMSLSASILAQHTRVASLVTALHSETSRLKHVALLSTRGRQVLLVVVLNSGEVHQQTLLMDELISQDQLNQVAARINILARGLDAQQLAELSNQVQEKIQQDVISVIRRVMRQTSLVSSGNVYRDGLTNVLSAPEFSKPEKAQQTLRIFEDRSLLDDLLSRTVFESDTGGIHVIIGGEGTWEELEECSMILAGYGSSKEAIGAVGILGPLRMSYSRGVSTVRFVSDVMSELISESISN